MGKTWQILSILALLILALLILNRNSKPKQVQNLPSIQGQTILLAGDIGDCSGNGNGSTEATGTAKLLDKFSQAPILTLGDNIYSNGTKEDSDACFDPTWGKYKNNMFPSIGNHDQQFVDKIPYYYDYFGKRAGEPGKGYYSFNLGSWHLIAINTNILVTPCNRSHDNCKGYFEQMAWIKKDLEQNKTDCTLIFGHHPRFTSQTESISYEATPLWELAYSENVDLIINGHVHAYERFAPQDSQGNSDPKKGIRQWIVGTGGGVLGGYTKVAKNSEVINNNKHGVLKLILGKGEYEWEFLSTDGSFVDRGKSACH